MWIKQKVIFISRFKYIKKGVVAFLIIPLIFLIFVIIKYDTTTHHIKGSTMGTFYTVTYSGNNSPRKIKPKIESLLLKINRELSNWNNDSWISRFNDNKAKEYIHIPEHAYQVLTYSLDLAKRTDGAFDPTLGRIINIWGFGPSEKNHLPKGHTINEHLTYTKADNIILKDDPPRIAKANSELRLNLSAVTKGYAADKIGQFLESKDIINYLINIGGEIRSKGSPQNNDAWTIKIQKPIPGIAYGVSYYSFKINSGGIATSGNYQRLHVSDKQKISHILDPRTGIPIQSNLSGVSIIAPTTIQADGIATASIVLGLEKAKHFVEEYPDVEGFFIERIDSLNFRNHKTTGWPNNGEERKLTMQK